MADILDRVLNVFHRRLLRILHSAILLVIQSKLSYLLLLEV
ncbi:unnamed protein product [Nippostrongylus brasiliensis]|uniref:Uncharacterized protein n=1 Tax=Nippostrongylus brasiliensis TaxID=27835 RepID=A0A0N4YH13_NIPBR|nr:unnamed protein product [Nippostrongylus brasiliensis]